MEHVSELAIILNNFFKWNKSRMYCFANRVIGLIKVRNVNLAELACAFAGEAKHESKYKRIVRFFKEFTFDYAAIARWVMHQFGLYNQPVYVSMDRTHWKLGTKDINLLMLSVVYKGIGIPVMWKLLDKNGSSNTEERAALITRFIDTFGKKQLAGVLADREFIGGPWIQWLRENDIPFCIRIKRGNIVTNQYGKQVYAWSLFGHLRYGEELILPTPSLVWSNPVFLSATRSLHGELVIIATDRHLQAPLRLYSQRWQVETLFAALKSRGFNFGKTHLTHSDRIEKLVILLAITFCWAHKTGEWRHSLQPIPLKKHGRLLYSYFRYGLDFIRSHLLNGLNFFCVFDVFATPPEPPSQLAHLSYLKGFS